MGGVEETFLQANMGGALLGMNMGGALLPWEEHYYMGGVGETFLQANMGGALLPWEEWENAPTSEHGRSNATSHVRL